MEELPPTSVPEPDPNKPAERTAGKLGALLFALICSVFLGYQCIVSDKRGEPISPLVFMPVLILIGGALGVPVDPAAIGQFLIKK